MRKIISFLALCACTLTTFSQHSIARKWNEILLENIRNDFARPTVHARNLFHVSAAMYDAWAVYNEGSSPYLMGGYCPLVSFSLPEDKRAAAEEAMSFAAYRILVHRFSTRISKDSADYLMEQMNYDIDDNSKDYWNGSPAALGNYIGECVINYGMTDGSNEANDYANQYYEPVNDPMVIRFSGNTTLFNPDRWQPLEFVEFVGQSGIVGIETPEFLSPEWGNVKPFSLGEDDLQLYTRDGYEYRVYHDPGPPPLHDSEEYKWGFSLVSIWSSHLDTSDSVYWDISPRSIGNIPSYPSDASGYPSFYKRIEGGDTSLGRLTNPATNEPYQEQLVPRGDYARVLAEFWADGPDSETPPGHWFTILNYVNDNPSLEKKVFGRGPVVDDLEWDVKSYFLLGGTMHDVAVSVWSIKGWYDYIRPVSAIRFMGSKGDPNQGGTNFQGLRLPHVEGYIETNEEGYQIIKAWRGPRFISDQRTQTAKVGWIAASGWWPYQRPNFVTPPFAGYVSGHSTFSTAAAVVLEKLTGSAFFPGGLGEFPVKKNEFLVFEDGPSVDLVLQWATYIDAADQCSLSRIWGGIHPPADDIPGRKIGKLIGAESVTYATRFFEGNQNPQKNQNPIILYPNPTTEVLIVKSQHADSFHYFIYDQTGKVVEKEIEKVTQAIIDVSTLKKGIYIMQAESESGTFTSRFVKN